MTGRVLIVCNGDSALREVHRALKSGTHFISRQAAASEVDEAFLTRFKPDLVLIDGGSGPSEAAPVLARLKQEGRGAETPVLMALSHESLERPQDLTVPPGVQDVVFFPAPPAECVARLLMAFRKHHRITDKSAIRAGELEVDVSRYEVKLSGRKVDLTFTEYELLKFFISHPGQVFNRDTLLNKVWGYDYFGGARTVDVHVRRLRSKVEYRKKKFIETVRNIGYRFIAQEED